MALNNPCRTAVRHFVLYGITLLFLFNSEMVVADDVAAFARHQLQKKAAVIAPYQRDVENLKQHMQQRTQSGDVAQYAAWFRTQKTPATTLSAPQKRYPDILVFVSFSLPPESLRQWLSQASAIRSNLVIRGLLNNSFKDTAAVIKPLVEQQNGGFLLDPTLFQRYHITKVPAVVVTTATDNEYAVVYGNTGLRYALTRIAASNTTAAGKAREALQLLSKTTVSE